MKKIEKAAISLIVLYLISYFMKIIRGLVLMQYAAQQKDTSHIIYMMIPYVVLLLGVNIAIAIWLYRTSQKEGASTPWVWASFGLIFSIPGAILFYVVRIYETLKIERSEPPN